MVTRLKGVSQRDIDIELVKKESHLMLNVYIRFVVKVIEQLEPQG